MILLNAPITHEIATQIITAIASSEHPHLYIDSPGGLLQPALKIVQAIAHHGNVTTICYGRAHSAAALILAAGTCGQRLMHSTATVFLHTPQIGPKTELPEADYQRVLQNYQVVVDGLWRLFAPDVLPITGDRWLCAHEALDLGIVDWIQQKS